MTRTGPTLLLGATGQLGTAMKHLVPGVFAPPRRELDLASITPADVVAVLEDMRPRLLINCAAYTAVDRAETEEAAATRINGTAVGVLAEATASRSIPFLTYSTDYVFAGDASRPYLESDRVSPINAYGRSKLLGEELAIGLNPRSLVVRTSWLISHSHPNFVKVILEKARDHATRVVNDQRGSPTIADDLARVSLMATTSGATGLLHLTNSDSTTWYELAKEAVRMAGMDPALVQPCSTSEFPTTAARPAYSVLGSERRDPLGLPPLPHWRDSLRGVVAALMRS